jgi:hypothetical protein
VRERRQARRTARAEKQELTLDLHDVARPDARAARLAPVDDDRLLADRLDPQRVALALDLELVV